MARILIFDEDLQHANGLADALHHRRHSVTVCRQQNVLIELGESKTEFEIVILDITRSRPSDWKLLDRIRELWTSVEMPKILCVSRVYRGPPNE
jgi:DNA-binding response OmpR family regulator